MQVVVEIPEWFKEMIDKDNAPLEFPLFLAYGIQQGIVIPKGHGRIGDLDKIKKEMQNYHDDCAETSEYTRLGFETAIAIVEDAKTIIEADEEGIHET